MSKNHDRKASPDIADILEGRVSPGAEELLDLIQRVNPTALDLPKKDVARRYAHKTRLQSLLFRRFPDDIEVVPEDGPVLLLRHRPTGRGTHTRLDELDADVRAAVQLRLDQAEPHDEVAPGRRGPPRRVSRAAAYSVGPVDRCLARGQAALDEYDYDAARAHLQEAVVLSAGDAPAALALLTVLVDHLSLSEEALALEPRLSPAALGHPQVRLLLSLAAARQGDAERAARLSRGPAHPRHVEVYCALAASTLSRGDLSGAAVWLDEAAATGVADPERLRLTEELSRRRAAARAGDEAELARLLQGGDPGAAAARARDVLSRWPDSALAGRTVREWEGRERAGRATRLLGLAEDELGRDRPGAALSLLAEALGTGVDGELRAQIEARLAAAHRRELALREDEQVAGVARQLAAVTAETDAARAARLLDGLHRYAGLSGAQRQRVRAAGELGPVAAHLAVLEELGDERAARGAAEAVIALLQAQAQGDPQVTLSLLSPHARVLSGLARARALQHEAERQVAQQRCEQAAQALEEARAELAAGAYERAVQRLSSSVLRALPAAAQEQAQALRQRALQESERALLEADFARLLQGEAVGSLFQARRLAEGQVAQHAGELGRLWAGRRAAAQERLQRSFRVRVVPVRDERPVGVDLDPMADRRGAWLLPGGEELVLHHGCGRWQFLQIVALRDGAVRQRVYLRAPAPIREPHVVVDEHSVWILGDAALQLVREGWQVGTWLGPGELERPGQLPAQLALSGDGQQLWILRRPERGGPGTTRVVDLGRAEVSREQDGSPAVTAVRGTQPALMVAGDIDAITLYEPRGAVARRWVGPELDQLLVACAHPERPGVAVVFVTTPPGDFPDDLRYVLLGRDVAEPGEPQRVGLLEMMSCLQGATALDDGMIVLLGELRAGDMGVQTLQLEGDELQHVHRASVPAGARLVQDHAGRRVALVYPTEGGGIVGCALGAAWAPPDMRAALPMWLPSRRGDDPCARPQGSGHTLRALEGVMKGRTPEHKARQVQDFQVDCQKGESQLSHFLDASQFSQQMGWNYVEQLEAGLRRYPAGQGLKRQWAGELAYHGRWGDVIDVLTGVPYRTWCRTERQHAYHLLVLAHMELGQIDEARALLAEAQADVAAEPKPDEDEDYGMWSPEKRTELGQCPLEALSLLLSAEAPAEPAEVPAEPAEVPAEPAAAAGVEEKKEEDEDEDEEDEEDCEDEDDYGGNGVYEKLQADKREQARMVRQLVLAMRRADEHLSRGEHQEAQRALDVPVVWQRWELQSSARLAQALLMGEEAGAEQDELLVALGLARLLDILEHAGDRRTPLTRHRQCEVPLFPGRWDEGRLAELAGRARAWLEGGRKVAPRGA